MEIKAAVYQVFYRMLCRSVIQKHFKEDAEDFKKITSRAVWDELGKIRFTEIFKSHSIKSVDYFYVKHRRFNDSEETYLVDDEIMSEAFKKYFAFSADVRAKAMAMPGPGSRAEYFHQEFTRIYKKDIDSLYLEMRATKAGLNGKPKTKKVDHSSISSQIDDQHLFEITSLLTNYFRDISNANYGLAWDRWSTSGKKEKWNRDFSEFKRHQVSGVEIISIENFTRIFVTKVQCEITLHYDSPAYELDTWKFRDYTIADLPLLVEGIDSLRNIHEANNSHFLDALHLHKLFTPGHFAFDRNTIHVTDDNSFASKKSEVRCSCVCIFEGEWLILSIDKAIHDIPDTAKDEPNLFV